MTPTHDPVLLWFDLFWVRDRSFSEDLPPSVYTYQNHCNEHYYFLTFSWFIEVVSVLSFLLVIYPGVKDLRLSIFTKILSKPSFRVVLDCTPINHRNNKVNHTYKRYKIPLYKYTN